MFTQCQIQVTHQIVMLTSRCVLANVTKKGSQGRGGYWHPRTLPPNYALVNLVKKKKESNTRASSLIYSTLKINYRLMKITSEGYCLHFSNFPFVDTHMPLPGISPLNPDSYMI